MVVLVVRQVVALAPCAQVAVGNVLGCVVEVRHGQHDHDRLWAFLARREVRLCRQRLRLAPEARQPIGIRGQEVAAVYQSQSPYDGTTENTSRGAREYNRFIFRRVSYLRVWTDDNVGGEFNRWFKEVAVPAARWKLYSQVLESELDVQAEVNTGLGPYIVTAEKRGVNWDFVRSKGLEFTDRQMDIDFNVHVPPEYPG